MTPKPFRSAMAAIGCAGVLLTGCGGGAKPEPTHALPGLTGLTLSQAEGRLQRIPVEWTFKNEGGEGFTSARESSGGANKALANRRITGQDPKPGTRVDRYDVVLLKLQP